MDRADVCAEVQGGAVRILIKWCDWQARQVRVELAPIVQTPFVGLEVLTIVLRLQLMIACKNLKSATLQTAFPPDSPLCTVLHCPKNKSFCGISQSASTSGSLDLPALGMVEM